MVGNTNSIWHRAYDIWHVACIQHDTIFWVHQEIIDFPMLKVACSLIIGTERRFNLPALMA